MTVNSTMQQAADRFAEALSRYPEGVQLAISIVLQNTVKGRSWEFIKDDSKSQEQIKVLRGTAGVYVAELNRAYLISVPFDKVFSVIKPISSGLITDEVLENAQKAYTDGKKNLMKFFDKGRDGTIGIFSLNESPSVVINGISYPSFSIDLMTLMEAMEAYGYLFVIRGRGFTSEQIRKIGFEKFLKECAISPSGNAVMVQIKAPMTAPATAAA